VIGSIRRECLDHVVVIGERHLREIMSKYVDYNNRTRTHLAPQSTGMATEVIVQKSRATRHHTSV
jgi:hypothetical protein